jgi:hypothetical protein
VRAVSLCLSRLPNRGMTSSIVSLIEKGVVERKGLEIVEVEYGNWRMTVEYLSLETGIAGAMMSGG